MDPRLRWQCRRGMRELDELLLGYGERSWASAGEAEKAAFRQLLALPDPELIAYLLGGQEHVDPVSAHVIRLIRNQPHPA